MVRRMRDARFRDDQWEHRFDPHVAPVNRYVDELRQAGTGWVPYVAPLHGGVDARVMSVLRDPGPGTQDGSGSGFLCVENDDPAAELQCDLLAKAGLSPADLLPWNAYPWYINAAPDGAKLRAGLPTLVRLLELAPRVEVLLLQGGEAQRSGRMLARHHPHVVRSRNLTVIESYHPARSALRTPDPAERERRTARRIEAFREVASALAG